jgi:16S rRNA (guanine(1405)-N(7))-methyltransferase
MKQEDDLSKLIENIHSSPKYQAIELKLIEKIGQMELAKRRNLKEAIKSTRSKLHQIATSFITSPLEFEEWTDELKGLSQDVTNPKLQAFCLKLMRCHSSTDERLPILSEFYSTIFKSITPIESILDLACGLNPLTIPWMPISRDCTYYAFDVLPDMVTFINKFFAHIGQKGKAFTLDLATEIPKKTSRVALLLKTLPTLDQIDKHAPSILLDQIKARHLVVSYPVHSLGGKSKGMVENYTAQFETLTANWNGTIKPFVFTTELAFLLTRKDQ